MCIHTYVCSLLLHASNIATMQLRATLCTYSHFHILNLIQIISALVVLYIHIHATYVGMYVRACACLRIHGAAAVASAVSVASMSRLAPHFIAIVDCASRFVRQLA